MSVFLWLPERDREAAVGSGDVGVLVVFQNTQDTEALVASEGSWVAAARKAAAARGETTAAEGRCDSAPPTTLRCSAHHPLPGAGRKSAHCCASRYTRVPLGRSP